MRQSTPLLDYLDMLIADEDPNHVGFGVSQPGYPTPPPSQPYVPPPGGPSTQFQPPAGGWQDGQIPWNERLPLGFNNQGDRKHPMPHVPVNVGNGNQIATPQQGANNPNHIAYMQMVQKNHPDWAFKPGRHNNTIAVGPKGHVRRRIPNNRQLHTA